MFAVLFRHGERIGFSYLVSQKYTGEFAKVKILRAAEVLEFNVQLQTHKRLIPAHIKGRPPSYYIVAGIVFAAVSVPYLRSEVSGWLLGLRSQQIYIVVSNFVLWCLQYGKDYDYDAPVKLLGKLLHSMAKTEDEQLVVISQVLFIFKKEVLYVSFNQFRITCGCQYLSMLTTVDFR